MKKANMSRYGKAEAASIRAMVRDLPPIPHFSVDKLSSWGLDHDEPWAVGPIRKIWTEIDRGTKKSVEIGNSFLQDPEHLVKSFHWEIGPWTNMVEGILSIELVLVSATHGIGNVILPQVVLRADQDLYYYWGID